MLALIARRVLALFPIVFIITLVAFLLVELIPGDVALAIAGQDAGPEAVAAIRDGLGLNKPFVERYLGWVWNMARGDFGRSLYSGESVGTLIAQRLPTTVSLTVLAVILGLMIGLPLGIIAGVSRNALVDKLITTAATAGVAVPNYVFALLFALIFGLMLGWFPTIGYTPVTTDPVGWLHHLFLPSLALSFTPAAVIARQVRGGMREVLKSDYIRTARAKGMSEATVIGKHALRNASAPALTALGIQVAMLLSGAVAVELVFALPGLGQLAVNAVGVRDLTVIQAVVVVGAVAVLLVNLVVDILYTLLNPKVAISS